MHADIIEKGTITVVGEGAIDAAITEDKSRKQVIFKNCDYLLTVSVKKVKNNIYIDNANDIDIEMQMYNLIECNHSCAKTPGIYDTTVEMNQAAII